MSKSQVFVAQFLSYCRNVSRTFVELCMAGRHIGVQFWRSYDVVDQNLYKADTQLY